MESPQSGHGILYQTPLKCRHESQFKERDGLNNEKNAFKMCSLKSHQTYGLNVGSYIKKMILMMIIDESFKN